MGKMFLQEEICFVGLKLIGYGLPLNLPYSRANFGWQAVGVPRAHVALHKPKCAREQCKFRGNPK